MKTACLVATIFLAVTCIACDGGVIVVGNVQAAAGDELSESEILLDPKSHPETSGEPLQATITLYFIYDPDDPSVGDDPLSHVTTQTRSDGTFETGSTCAPFKNIPMKIKAEAPGYRPAELEFTHYTKEHLEFEHHAIVYLAPNIEESK